VPEKEQLERTEARGEAPERERRSDEAVGAVVQHATVPSAREMRAEAVGAVVQQATVPSAREMRGEVMGAVAY
jgi:hypothetical protein